MAATTDFIHHFHDDDENTRLMVKSYGCARLNGGDFPNFMQDPFAKKDFSEKELRKFLPRLGAAILFYLVGIYINNISQAWLQANMAGFYESEWGYSQPTFQDAQNWLKIHKPEVYEDRWHSTSPNQTSSNPNYARALHRYYQNQTLTLYDVVFLYLPNVSSSKYADRFAGIPGLVGILRFVVVPGPMSLRWTYLTRGMMVWGSLFYARALTIIVTPLPNPYHQCVPKTPFPNSVFLAAFANMPGILGVFYNPLTCQDVMFSGHTAMGTSWTLMSWRYFKKAPWFKATITHDWISIAFDVFAICWLLWGWYVIAASHFHYTVDVMVGALLTFMSYNFYHNVIQTIWLKEKHPFHQGLGPFLMWLEKHSYDLKHWRASAQKLMDDGLHGDRWVSPTYEAGEIGIDDSSFGAELSSPVRDELPMRDV